MKKTVVLTVLVSFISAICFAQSGNITALERLEQNSQYQIVPGTTAILKSASRLFGGKDDLTTVILIIPVGTEVDVLGADSLYVRVVYDGTEGYIFNRNLTFLAPEPFITEQPQSSNQVSSTPQQANSSTNNTTTGRFSQLESKYGSSLAARIYAGKIWKGMSAEMVTDSWGTPEKINRSISSSLVREEWIYRNTWLFFESGRLVEWGPVTR